MNRLVDCAYTTSQRTVATKQGGIEETSLRRNNDSVATNRPVSNAVGLHFVNSIMHAFTTKPYVLSGRAGVRVATVQNVGLERPDPRAAGNINKTAGMTLASEDGVDQMVVTRSQSMELRLQKKLQQQKKQQ